MPGVRRLLALARSTPQSLGRRRNAARAVATTGLVVVVCAAALGGWQLGIRSPHGEATAQEMFAAATRRRERGMGQQQHHQQQQQCCSAAERVQGEWVPLAVGEDTQDADDARTLRCRASVASWHARAAYAAKHAVKQHSGQCSHVRPLVFVPRGGAGGGRVAATHQQQQQQQQRRQQQQPLAAAADEEKALLRALRNLTVTIAGDSLQARGARVCACAGVDSLCGIGMALYPDRYRPTECMWYYGRPTTERGLL